MVIQSTFNPNRGQYQFTYSVNRLMEMLNCPSQYTFNDFRKNSLLIAQRELQQKAGINLDWIPSRKEGKKIMELTFSILTAKQLAAQAVDQDRLAINQMSINEAVSTAWQLMKNYKLKSWQKDLIASNRDLLETFFRLDSELGNGLRTNIKNPTAYLVKSLGIDQLKASTKPKKASVDPPQLPLIASATNNRSTQDKSIGDVIGSLFN